MQALTKAKGLYSDLLSTLWHIMSSLQKLMELELACGTDL